MLLYAMEWILPASIVLMLGGLASATSFTVGWM
jgi:hypothetical protein